MQMLNDTYQDILTDEERAKEVAKEILEVGHIELKDFLAPAAWEQFLAEMTARKEESVTLHGAGTSLGKGDELKGTFGYEFGHSQEIKTFCRMIHIARCELEGKSAVELTDDKHLIGFPYKDARAGKVTQVTAYHFDAAYINILIPIILPEDREKSGGNLTVFPNMRKKYGVTLSKFIGRLLRTSVGVRKLFGGQTVVYSVGSAHVFFGDISFHGVDPISDGERLVMTINSHW